MIGALAVTVVYGFAVLGLAVAIGWVIEEIGRRQDRADRRSVAEFAALQATVGAFRDVEDGAA